MAKKIVKKKSRVLKTELGLVGRDLTMRVFEGYGTVKNRLLDVRAFLEVTTQGPKKVVLNKGAVEYIRPL